MKNMKIKQRPEESVRKDVKTLEVKKIVLVEEKFHPKRVVVAILFVAITTIFACAYAWMGRLASGGILCEALIIVPACLIFVAYLLHERKSKRLWYEDTDYVSLIVLYAVANGLLFAESILTPAWLAPVMLSVFIITPFRDRTLSLVAAIIAVSAYSFGSGVNGRTVCLYLCEIVIAVMLSELIFKAAKGQRAILFVLIVAVQMVLPVAGRYFEELAIKSDEIIYAALLAVVTAAFAVILLPVVNTRVNSEKIYRYQTIIDNDYPLIGDIRLFSADEYERARKLSVLALKAAQEIGADPYLAAAGGLYYRVGLIRGDKEIDCAMDIAAENGFPEKLTAILYEYQGLIRRPTSKESAIVHMCDSVMRKMDAISKQGNQMDSGWNKQMLIYQTFNDLSLSGIYDDSGISINQFLRIRNVLVKEL